MKTTIFLFLFSTAVFYGCVSKETQIEFDKIEYRSVTRGYSELIFIQSRTFKYMQKGNEVLSLNLTDQQYSLLSNLIKELGLISLNKLTIPSDNHQSDKALFTTLEIVLNDLTYSTQGFDHDNPPKELTPLINYLYRIIKQ